MPERDENGKLLSGAAKRRRRTEREASGKPAREPALPAFERPPADALEATIWSTKVAQELIHKLVTSPPGTLDRDTLLHVERLLMGVSANFPRAELMTRLKRAASARRKKADDEGLQPYPKDADAHPSSRRYKGPRGGE